MLANYPSGVSSDVWDGETAVDEGIVELCSASNSDASANLGLVESSYFFTLLWGEIVNIYAKRGCC